MHLRPNLAPSSPARRPRALRAVAIAVFATMAAGLTACSSSDDNSSSSSGSGGGGTFPAKVATKFGDVTVKEQPKRVVALGWGDAETALALGVRPVGQSDWLAFGGDGVGPWAKGLYKKSPQKIGTLEPEYEKIAALKPDLILDTKSSGDQKRYNTLSKIAPTIGVPKGGDQYKTSWEKQTRMVSSALGIADKGKSLISKTEKKFEKAKAAHPEFKGKSIVLGSRTSVGYGAYVHGTGRMDFVERLGFKSSPAIEAKAGSAFSVTVSRENLDLLDADLTVMSPIGLTAKKISGDPLYRAVPSVKAGRDVVFDDETLSSAFATDSVLSVGYALDKVVPVFSDTLKNPKPLKD
ncbi:iron-siderophore ABC transporter substrate-binding protein [Streptomyces tsukubensis]|uniref:ABC transporter substrate-binding protein n=1 Tax=Streptomyces tsukubensis TaxID=83656 RepID=A0A1V4A548_9ACTN|nr:iron-siderophore ABC transporter substrate-binding protein [Streptomyces tsukubensis]OON75585.1 ABC transporter substrate-binding protein [Streptomyces tsukubensis]QFR94436.1 ABC transporter substrate-binding protein [Streptomyces tsukubensis]